MNWDLISKILLAALPVAAAAVQLIRRKDGRVGQLKTNLELLALLPEDGPARAKLLDHIERSVERLIVEEDELRREPMGIALGIVFLAVAIGLTVFAFRDGGWWWWPIIIFIAIMGATGLGQDGVRRKRDAKGRPIKG
ncbi:MAG TPA: hypothetical protein VG317_11900 [Pseudonocardiaceae bacterium]|jgi:hypothetical protein|nr:hypothetical protein [Pseudonocardiaceae bacterium]